MNQYWRNQDQYNRKKQGPYPVFQVTIRNSNDHPTQVSAVRYRTLAITGAKSAGSKTIEPTVTLRHQIAHTVGDQGVSLSRPIVVEPNTTDAFYLELRPDNCMGCAWLTSLVFEIDGGHSALQTPPLSIWMSTPHN